jgi:hypothetical protein
MTFRKPYYLRAADELIPASEQPPEELLGEMVNRLRARGFDVGDDMHQPAI